MLGAVMLTGLAALCAKHLGFGLAAFQTIKFPVAFALSSIAVQVLVHGESVMADHVRALINFINTLIVIQTLTLRPGFLNRYMIVMLLNGLSLLPLLRIEALPGGVARADLDRSLGSSALSNANALGANFGFYAAYFTILGLEGKRDAVRLLSWVIALGCLFVVGLTVSRSALLAFALAMVVLFRHLLKYGLFPIIIIILLSAFLFSSGLFSKAEESYTERGTEETGRLLVWPLVVERFFDNVLTGVGDSEVETYIVEIGKGITPHNSFLFVGLTSGIVPLLFFAVWWLKVAAGAVRLERANAPSSRFYLPLLIYCFVQANFANNLMPPTVVVLAVILTNYRRQAYHQLWRQVPARLQRPALATPIVTGVRR